MTVPRDLIIVVGARPNFMKVAPILRVLAAQPGAFRPRVVHTGQHYDRGLSGVFLEHLGLSDIEAQLGSGSGTHGQQTARILEGFEGYLLGRPASPAGVVVVGDVNSTFAAALAAVKLGIPVAHVEAGLRSGDRTMPEEINRILTDATAEILLVSEPSGLNNLWREGVPGDRVFLVGNVMIDTLKAELPAARALGMPARMAGKAEPYALVTLHRPANVDDPERLEAVLEFLTRVGRRIPVVFPMHPRTRSRLVQHGLLERFGRAPGLHLGDPLGYHEHLGLMAEATVVLTDSGGVQEETAYLGIPCLTLRPNTERPITVTEGTNTLVGSDFGLALKLVESVLDGTYKTGRPIAGWDGHAAERIVEVLEKVWG
jgi:UDP-N-acetylglucosamine 2-epimerase (non-hydrolysing)